MMKKFLWFVLLLVAPFAVGWLISLIWQLSILLVAGGLYLILFLCLTPSGDFLSASASYEAKKINPNHSVEVQQKTKMKAYEILRLALLFLLSACCFYLYFS